MILSANLRDYFENSPVALSLARSEDDNELLLVNGRFSALTGYDPADVVGHNCRVLQQCERRGEIGVDDARRRIHEFLRVDRVPNVRCVIVNFRKDGTPFVNLLYLSKLRDLQGRVRFLFGSQFDVSRAQPELLQAYDAELSATITRISPIVAESGLMLEGTLTTIANSAATVAQARFTLANLDDADRA